MTDVFLAAQHLVSLGRPQLALDKLAEAFAPDDPLFWWLRGVALFDLDRTSEALASARDGLQLDPESTLLLSLATRCHIALGELSAAEQTALAALRLDPDDPDLLAQYALIAARAGQPEKAAKLIARARRIDPEHAGALRIDAALAMARGDAREALLRSRELLAIDPEDPHAHALAGGVLQERGDLDAASAHLRHAVLYDPSDNDYADAARQNLALTHWAMWPLRPIQRFGAAPVWLTGVALVYGSTYIGPRVSTTVVISWIVYCVYTWVVPPLVERRIRRGR